MGLFGKNKDKKLCLACGKKTDFIHIRLAIEGGWLCHNCLKKLSPFVEANPENLRTERDLASPVTIGEYQAHLAWLEECKALDAVFVPEERYDDPVYNEPLLEIDRTNGLFRVLRSGGAHADVMRLADLRDVHPVVVEYLHSEGTQGERSRQHYYYFNMRIGMDLPLMQRAEFVACAWYVYGGTDVMKRKGGYRLDGQTTMKEADMREYERRLAECQKLALVFTGQAGSPELRVVEGMPSQDRNYPVGSLPKVNMFGPEIR